MAAPKIYALQIANDHLIRDFDPYTQRYTTLNSRSTSTVLGLIRSGSFIFFDRPSAGQRYACLRRMDRTRDHVTAYYDDSARSGTKYFEISRSF